MSINRGDESNKRHRELLNTYYGINNEVETTNETNIRKSVCDIDDPNFDSDVYLKTLLKQKNLSELVEKEQQMVKSIRELDSDMQMLVYENYNKFISATDTIRKMKSDLLKMEDEMDILSSRMHNITQFSSSISSTLQDRRQHITKLSGVHTLLKKLQFLFNLPNKLQSCVDQGHYSQAVTYFIKARRVLHQYQHTPSLHGIQSECSVIIQKLVSKLRLQFKNKDSDPKQLVECVDLLMQLNEPAEVLCEEFLSHAGGKIEINLEDLELQLKLWQNMMSKSELSSSDSSNLVNAMDILEFIDLGSNGFLSNLSLVIASYNDLFLNRQPEDFWLDPLDLYRLPSLSAQLDVIASKRLVSFVDGMMMRYVELVRKRVMLEKSPGDCTIQVRALDRFYRRLQALHKLLPGLDFSKLSIELISQAARDRVQLTLGHLQVFYADRLTDIRQSLASPSGLKIHTNQHLDTITVGGVNENSSLGLVDLVKRLHSSLVEQVKTALNNLQAFIDPNMTFTMKQFFRNQFCLDVRDGLVASFFAYVINTSLDFTHQMDEKSNISFSILLITSRLCHDMALSSIENMFSLTDEQFRPSYTGEKQQKQLAAVSSSTAAEAKTAAQMLLNHYVKLQGSTISQMLRKSVETRDCLSGIEPRSVKSVMKRVVEDITSIDKSIGQVYEEGSKTERLSDSTAHRSMASRLFSGAPGVIGRSNWSYAHSSMDNSLMNNIQKLFVEKIEIFSAVNFNKMSVMTGIIKICLKTLMECVRQKTFGRYGLQQVQVDCHYLDLYLWNFVQDENLVHMLLDEIISSTLHRCLDPVPMEPSVVDLICERG